MLPIALRTIHGAVAADNHGSLVWWGTAGTLMHREWPGVAYGCHTVVVVLDPETMQVGARSALTARSCRP